MGIKKKNFSNHKHFKHYKPQTFQTLQTFQTFSQKTRFRMEEVQRTTLLEYHKSTFLIDLINHGDEVSYVRIQQNIEGVNAQQELKINPSVLTDLIFVLQDYENEISKTNPISNKSYFSPEKQKAVVERYLKGIQFKDLTLQFDCSEKIIEQILRNKGLEVVDNYPPKTKERFRYKRKK